MNILKQLEVSDIGSKTNRNIRNTKWRLTLVYSVVIIFVIGVLNISIYTLYNERFSDNIFSRIEEESHEHLTNEELSEIASEELFEVMIMIDILLFVLVFGLSYYLSRKALQPLDLAYNEQKKFLGNVAHELRTPLTVMRTGLEAYSISNNQSNSPAIKQSIDEIDHMSNILNDLIFLVKNETVAEHPKDKIDLSVITSSEIQKIIPYAKTRNIAFGEFTALPNKIIGNEMELRQMVKNLLKNAVDYNKPGGNVFTSIKSRGGRTILEIQDTGIGIAKDNIPMIFDRFFKADNSRPNHPNSTGLGLAIVESIVKKNGGNISIQSSLGVGTTVSVSFKSA